MKKYIDLLRLKHYVKNVLIFIPIVCSNNLTIKNIILICMAFFAFSFIASSIYIINDLSDLENDKLHSEKKNRPIASGKISIKTARLFIAILFVLSLLFNTIVNKSFFNLSLLYLMIYFVLNILYSLFIKKVAIIDIIFLASFYILRIYYGAAIFDIGVSKWLFLTILSFSLFICLNKRKFDLNKKGFRIKEYTITYLNNFAYLMLGLTLVFYSLWSMEQINYMIYTVVFLIIIFMRYILVIEQENNGDPITILYHDKPLIFSSMLYIIIFLGLFIFK